MKKLLLLASTAVTAALMVSCSQGTDTTTPPGPTTDGYTFTTVSDAVYYGAWGGMTIGLCLIGWAAGAAAQYVLRRNFGGCLLCSAAGLALLALSRTELAPLRERLGLDQNSRVLCLSTEGATDQANYRRVVWGLDVDDLI